MISLLFTDYHLKRKRIEEQEKILKQIIEVAVKKKVKTIYFLGDMFDDRRTITIYELLAFKNFKKELKTLEIRLVCIAGNHDKPYNDSNVSYLGIFKNENDLIFEERKVCRIDNMGFIPYFSNKVIISLIENFKEKNKIKYLFMHTGFDGARTNNGYKMKSNITLSLFKKYKNLKRIFVGHYHEKNKLFSKYVDYYVTYIGNPYQLNHGESVHKSIYLFNEDNGKLVSISLDFPKFKTFNLKCNSKDYLKAFNIVKKEKGNYIRLCFLDEKKKLSSIPEKGLNKYSNCKELKIEKDFFDLNNADDNQIKIKENIVVSFKKYGKQENMTKKEILFGIKLLKELKENNKELKEK